MKQIKLILLLLFAILFQNQFIAQITIDGTITDSESNPINNALVEIIDQDDTTIYYRDSTNESGYFNISNIFTDISNRTTQIPSDFLVLRNYPNPFNPSTIIYYELPNSENIEIKIYDILGREVRTLFNDFHKAGTYTIEWNSRNDWNAPVAAGVYFCRLKAKENFKVHKMLLLDGGSYSTNISSITQKKEKSNKLSKSNGIFNYSIKVSGNDILESEFKYLSCSGDTSLSLIVPKVLQTAIIGAEGGKLEIDDFSLTVPEGAFSETTELILTVETDSIDVGEKEYSKLFRVDGLPEFYESTLVLKIKTIDQPTDSISIIVAQIDTSHYYDREYYNFDYYKATYNKGYAELVLPANPSFFSYNDDRKQLKLNTFSNSKKLFIVLSSPGTVFSSNHNFIIYYPKTVAGLVPYIDDLLESAIDTVQNLGFYKLPSRTSLSESNWPVKVFFNSTLTHATEYYEGLYKQKGNRIILSKYWSIAINPKLNSSEVFSQALGSCVFNNFIHQNFLFGHNDKKIDVNLHPNYWLLSSLAHWSEKLFPYDNNYINSDYNPNVYGKYHQHWVKINSDRIIYYVLEGLNKLRTLNSYSFIPLIEHITRYNQRSNKIVYDIYNSVIENESSIKGLITALNETENIWWPEFFKELIQGNIYNLQSELFLKNTTSTIEFKDSDTLKNVDETYNDLSAKLFKIDISSDDIKSNKYLNFKLGPESLNLDYVKTLVFGYSFNRLTFISEGTDFLVGNLDEYDWLLACVVNSGNEPPYTGTSSIQLDVKTINSSLPLKGRMTISAKFLENLHYKDQNQEIDIKGAEYIDHYISGNVKLISEDTYWGTWDEDDAVGYHHKGTMKVIINPDSKNLLYFEGDEVRDGDQFAVINEKMISNNINLPYNTSSSWYWNYLQENGNACSTLKTLEYSEGNENWNQTLTKYSCNENSYVRVSFNFDE